MARGSIREVTEKRFVETATGRIARVTMAIRRGGQELQEDFYRNGLGKADSVGRRFDIPQDEMKRMKNAADRILSPLPEKQKVTATAPKKAEAGVSEQKAAEEIPEMADFAIGCPAR
ncbi:MAG: hypothetical protein PHP03_03635 [Candidatus Pacebacteria bacterium]|nr:hypothetical protein [Candidatus Paceibacterota bacterium]